MSQLHGVQLSHTEATGEKFTLTCRVTHTPTNCNFWHYLILWNVKSEENNMDGKSLSKRKLRRIAAVAKHYLMDIAKVPIPTYQEIPKSIYVK